MNIRKRKYSKEDIDSLLELRNIKRVGPYINGYTPFEVECSLDGYRWKPILSNLLKGFGCHRCSGNERYTNKTFDEKLTQRNITRIDDYKTSQEKIHFKCLICSHIWEARPARILHGRGCPKCNGGIRITNEEFDIKIRNKNLLRLSDYINSNSPIKMQCLKDNYIWIEEHAHNIFDAKTPCPICPKSHKSTDQLLYEIKIKNPDIELIGKITKADARVEWRCLKDGEMFLQSPCRILTIGYGCPYCKKKGELEAKRIIEEQVKVYDYYKHQKSICINNKRYVVDFYIIKDGKHYLIERNGQQHYKPIRFGGMSYKKAEECFEKQKARDNQIKEYCQGNGIQYIEIPYWYKQEEIINSIKDII